MNGPAAAGLRSALAAGLLLMAALLPAQDMVL
jgi:hypothetical protein